MISMLLRRNVALAPSLKSRSARSLLQCLWWHKSGRSGLVLSIIVLLVALVGSVWTPYDPDLASFSTSLKPPSADHLLGTDEMGRDTFSRLLNAAHRSVGAAFLVLASSFGIGLFVGVFSGLVGGNIDSLLMRLVDVVMALPSLILAFAILGILGPGFGNLLVALILSDWAWYARLARSLAIGSASRPDILTARLAGISRARIVVTHLLPSIATKLGVMATLAFGSMISAISGFSFLGLGVQPPNAEWGAMLSQSRLYFDFAPWLLLSPAIAIFLSVLAANLLGHALRDISEMRNQ